MVSYSYTSCARPGDRSRRLFHFFVDVGDWFLFVISPFRWSRFFTSFPSTSTRSIDRLDHRCEGTQTDARGHRSSMTESVHHRRRWMATSLSSVEADIRQKESNRPYLVDFRARFSGVGTIPPPKASKRQQASKQATSNDRMVWFVPKSRLT